ncbi:hypothetical protein SASPL_150584 [Salvia splendens]|uniref:Myb-like domain-containing protein n=1 Tax=Salvia splendens TaxID=180675 RepID=A0A8X8W6U0_SALSN|nr:uncharacterized protein LOC121781303 [Salvia splendens]KAG6389125.1 hypothetical protein SASPL_150584 [Salvia splendens]
MAAGDSNNSNGDKSVKENSGVRPNRRELLHNPGLSLEWKPQEESALEDLLEKYASESTPAVYVRIAQALRSKTVRDVALRCIWMSKKENGKRKKEDISSLRKNEGKKEGLDALAESSQVPSLVNGLAVMSVDVDVDSVDRLNAIDDPARQILRNNARALDQISINLSACKLDENIRLFIEARANMNLILKEHVQKLRGDINLILKDLRLEDKEEFKQWMPSFPVKLNDDLANSILPPLNTDADQTA